VNVALSNYLIGAGAQRPLQDLKVLISLKMLAHRVSMQFVGNLDTDGQSSFSAQGDDVATGPAGCFRPRSANINMRFKAGKRS